MKQSPFGAMIVLTALAACTSTQSVTPSINSDAGLQPRISWISPELHHTKERLLYVADTYLGEVLIYRQRGLNQKPIGKLTSGITSPTGLWVDPQRNLWVANDSGLYYSNILRFPQGSTTPDLVLADPDWHAYSVWVGQRGGVYVVNFPYSGSFEIVEYPPRKTTPKFIGDRRLANFIFAVVGDAKGDLFASGYTQSGAAEVDERPAGSKHWRNTGIRLAEPGGLAFDGSGNLVVSDLGYDVIETFPPGQTKPSNSIACSAQCDAFAFDHGGKRLWVAEYNDANGTIEERTYPSGTVIDALQQPQGSAPQGIAVTPDLYP